MKFLDVLLWSVRIASALFFIACLVAMMSKQTMLGGWIDPSYAPSYLIYCALVESGFLNYQLSKKLKAAEAKKK
ncbi:MAG: hypothetical protein EOP10_00485 [Proteobacteria bacterium]|nr:MAG: hypothetical protein EOP10_00485 [Pseudomonadota bacterium]